MSASTEDSDVRYTVVEMPAVSAGDTSTVVLPNVVRDFHVVSLQIVPRAAITANATNFAVITLQDRGVLGSGSTAMASRSWATVNSGAGTKELATLNATPANLEGKQGDQLIIVHSTGGTGLALPAIAVLVGWLPRL